MADFSELPLRYRLEMAVYRWRRLDPVPWTRPAVPLRRAKVALLTTGGLYRPQIDEPFRRVRGGDYSFRVVPDDVELESLVVGQTSEAFDRRPAEADRNAVLPIERLRTLVERGEVGSSAPRHLSFNGSITAPGRLVGESAPQAADLLTRDGVQAALLVPV